MNAQMLNYWPISYHIINEFVGIQWQKDVCLCSFKHLIILHVHQVTNFNALYFTSDLTSQQDVCNKLRGLLNKLSTRNFENVSYQISRLPIKDEEMMMMCINIIFEKVVHLQTSTLYFYPQTLSCYWLQAVMEPNFSELYAALSKKFSKVRLFLVSVFVLM